MRLDLRHVGFLGSSKNRLSSFPSPLFYAASQGHVSILRSGDARPLSQQGDVV